jgi:type IV pilus assembly protein PilA
MFKFAKKGFTLIELIVVVIVLGILMGIAIPSFLGASSSAKAASQKASIMTEYKAARVVYANNDGSYTPASGTLIQAVNAAEPELTAVDAAPASAKEIEVAVDGTNPELLTLTGFDGSTLVSTNGVVDYTAGG